MNLENFPPHPTQTFYLTLVLIMKYLIWEYWIPLNIKGWLGAFNPNQRVSEKEGKNKVPQLWKLGINHVVQIYTLPIYVTTTPTASLCELYRSFKQTVCSCRGHSIKVQTPQYTLCISHWYQQLLAKWQYLTPEMKMGGSTTSFKSYSAHCKQQQTGKVNCQNN